MQLPSFSETLGGTTLGPDIVIVRDGDLFPDSTNESRALEGLNIQTMNEELAKTSSTDELIFENSGPPPKDIPFQAFLEEQRAAHAQTH